MKSLVILVSLGVLSTAASASEVIAKFDGASKNYSKCELNDSSKGVISIGDEGYNNFALESSKLTYDQIRIRNLGSSAIKYIPNEFSQWSAKQDEYSTRGQFFSPLTIFYAEGFRNLLNNSSESIELRKIIDHLCNDKLKRIRMIGEFDIDLKVGSNVLKDKLIFKHNFNPEHSYSNIKGKYIVPNSFDSKIYDLVYRNGQFKFTIHVVEGDQDYHASFEGAFVDDTTFSGAAFILPQRKFLGSFTGKRSTSDE